jgi:lipid-binding SYLF domain-containing protein
VSNAHHQQKVLLAASDDLALVVARLLAAGFVVAGKRGDCLLLGRVVFPLPVAGYGY